MALLCQNVSVVVAEADRVLFERLVPTVPFDDEGKARYFLNTPDSHQPRADWLVLQSLLREKLLTHVPRERRVFVTTEPSPLHGYSADYLNQFGILISPFSVRGFEGRWIYSHQGLPWWFGIDMGSGHRRVQLTWHELFRMPPPQKQAKVSVVVSNKRFHAGHRLRLRFLDHLKSELGEDLQIFGRGICEINDKADAIIPFGCHLAMENTLEPGYWSEKLSDALLGYALPIYSGCPDVARWLPEDALVRIDIKRPAEAIRIIRECLDRKLWLERSAAILGARQHLMAHETYFHMLARILRRAIGEATESRPRPEWLLPPGKKSVVERVSREIKRIYYKAIH